MIDLAAAANVEFLHTDPPPPLLLPAITSPATLRDKASADNDFHSADGPTPATRLVKSQVHVPAAVPPGISSTTDFPPLATPPPIAPAAAPKIQRKATTVNVASPIIKPVVPVLSSQDPRTAPALGGTTENQPSIAKDQQITVSSSSQIEKAASDPAQKAKSKGKTSAADPHIQHRPKSRPKGTTPHDVLAAKGIVTQSTLDQDSAGTAARQQPLEKVLDNPIGKEASKSETNAVTTSLSEQIKSKETSSSVVPDEPRPVTPTASVTTASHASGSSITRQPQSRTLRVVSTPIAEPPPRVLSASPLRVNVPPTAVAAVAGPSSAAKRQASRRGSIASVQVPGTPLSERISDNASFTSASISRANTPPPAKIGSAPVRQVSKSQQKKERQARAKLNEEISKAQDAPVSAIAEQAEQAPIIGRKKKIKKNTTSGTADSTPTATRPSSPTPKGGASASQRSSAATAAPAVSPVNESPVGQSDNRLEGETPASPGISSGVDQQSNKNSLTAAAILARLQKSGDISPTILNIFKGVAGANYRFELGQADFAESETGPILSAAQARQINEGDAITFDYPPNKRIVILPDRRLLRGLSAEQAQRYLELRKRILSTPETTTFHSPRHSIDRYLHASPHHHYRGRSLKGTASGGIGGGEHSELDDQYCGLDNRFVSPPLTQSSTSTMPAYWSASPLSEDNGGSMGRRSSGMGVNEAEKAMSAARRETDALDKKLNALMKRNRKLVFGNGSH